MNFDLKENILIKLMRSKKGLNGRFKLIDELRTRNARAQILA